MNSETLTELEQALDDFVGWGGYASLRALISELAAVAEAEDEDELKESLLTLAAVAVMWVEGLCGR